MKHLITYVSIVLAFVFQSCSSEDEPLYTTDFTAASVNDDQIVYKISHKNSHSFGEFDTDSVESESNLQTRGNSDIMPLLDYVNYTVKGATSTSTSANQKVQISSKLANLMGISRQIYVLNYITAKYSITIDGLSSDRAVFKIVDSPGCGLDPSKTDYARGYTYGSDGDVVTLTTRIVHILSDLSGRNYDMYYPCKPENLIWNYKVAAE